MKKSTLVVTAAATALTASIVFAGWGGHHGGYGIRAGAGGWGDGPYTLQDDSGKDFGRGFRGERMQKRFNRELSKDEITTIMKSRLIQMDNSNLKIGTVTTTDSGYSVTIVTRDDSLVEELQLAKNGMRLDRYQLIQQRLKSQENSQ